ncbi:hypothetical protein [Saccharicrinis sp. GN24d3]|uniref:hypothetical protein n=1 Tax=Saccharicrinis sp. GN24d3 TaxID=3458416 RepID=UPI004035D420
MKEKIKQWLLRADEKDKGLSKKKRQVKWIGILTLLFVLYVITFLKPGQPDIGYTKIRQPGKGSISESDSLDNNRSPFELPVDSFEQLLNAQIHDEVN